MKKTMMFVIGVVLLFSMINTAFALDKEELKQTLKELTVDELYDIKKNATDKVLKTAEDSGYIKNMMGGPAIGGGGGFNFYMPTNVSANIPAGVALDNVSQLYGGGGGFVVNMDKNWAWGVNFGGMGGFSQKKIGLNYYNYSVGTNYAIPYVTYKPIITPQWIVDMNLGAGYMMGGYTYTVTNEAMVGTDVSRWGSTIPVMAEIEARYRILPVWFVGFKAGYLSASINELKRANFVDTTQKPIDFSGGYLAVTMGGNF